jgi:hypothetical protein
VKWDAREGLVWDGALYFREECGVGLQGRFGLEGSTGDLWLVQEDGGSVRGGQEDALLEKTGCCTL